MRLVPLALVLLLAATAHAVTDHLQCFKVTNATLKSLKGVVDLDAPGIGLAPGCTLSKAKLYCVPAAKTVQPGTLFDGRTPLEPLPFPAEAAETGRICYKVKCQKPVGTAPDQVANDQFGLHQFTKLSTEMVCTPAAPGTLPPPVNGFQIATPEVDVAPGQEITYCYYFRTPNTQTLAIRRWVSEMPAVNRDTVVFTTTDGSGQPVDKMPPGTLSAANCGFGGGTSFLPNWLYAAYTPSAELALPLDDGTGKPVAIEIPPNTAGFVRMHFVNETGATVKGKFTLNAEPLPGSTPFSKAAAYVAYNNSIEIPPQSVGTTETQTCAVPAGVVFTQLSTHAHKQATRMAISHGTTTVFESFDWQNPGTATFPPPFLAFPGNQLTFACTYTNPTNRTIRTGDSTATDEVCMAIGYFFPATKPLLCFDGFGPF